MTGQPPHSCSPDEVERLQDLVIDQSIQAARSLIRIARNPHNDAQWPRVRDWLRESEAQLAARPASEATERKLLIVRTLLKGHRA